MALPGVDAVARHPEGAKRRSQQPSSFFACGGGGARGSLIVYKGSGSREQTPLLKIWEPEERGCL